MEMSAKRLEEFIGLIETAERVSKRPPSSAPEWRGSWSAHPPRGVPHLVLPSRSSSPTPARLVGSPASHCGLSSISTNREENHCRQRNNNGFSREQSSLDADQTTGRSTNASTVRSRDQDLPHCFSLKDQDLPQHVPPNPVFIRKILDDQHPASPDTQRRDYTGGGANRRNSLGRKGSLGEVSKKEFGKGTAMKDPTSRKSSIDSSGKQNSVEERSTKDYEEETDMKDHTKIVTQRDSVERTQRKDSVRETGRQPSVSPQSIKTESPEEQIGGPSSRKSSAGSEKPSSPVKMPPKFPRDNSIQSFRNQSPTSSPDKKTRSISSSPSPVRTNPPKPSSHSCSYSSSFSSSTSATCSRSPSGSPKKLSTRSSAGSVLDIDESHGSHASRRSMSTKRKSWVAASSSRQPGNSQSSSEQKLRKTGTRSISPQPEVLVRQKEYAEKIPRMSAKPQPKSVRGKVVIKEELGKDIKTKSSMIRRRPQSAPGKKPSQEPLAPLGDFSKSLRLLGLEIPSSRTEASKLTDQEVKVSTTEPTVKTRIMKRSGSYADLTQSIRRDMKVSEFEAVKDKVNDAVFEQWYFKKCAEGRERRRKHEEEEELKKKEKEEKEKEVEELSKVEFAKWCRQKKAQLEKERKSKDIRDKGKVTKVVDKEEVERKNKEWLALKRKEFQKKKEDEDTKQKAEEAKRIDEDKKRTQAEKTFIAWKEAKTKELKERYLAEKQKQKEKEEGMVEKRKDAESAFIGWKNKKHEKMKDKVVNKEKNDKSKEDEARERDNNAKLEEAKRAYEAWLDLIEEREEEQLLFEEERKRILMWKPPWYAGGKPLF